MSLTESGHAVRAGVNGVTVEHHPPADGPDRAPGVPDVHVDGFNPRNSARPDLYPHAPQAQGASDSRAVQAAAAASVPPVAGRLDEVTAPDAAEKAAAAAEVPAMQLVPQAAIQ